MGDESDENMVRPGKNGADAALMRVGFGTKELVQQRETQGSALAARAQAEVQARYIMAMNRPRNIAEVRVRLLEHCKRTGFAQVAEYEKPVGGQKIRGPSIRFVETALQEYGNVIPDATIVYDDDQKRVMRVSVTDLERNVTYNDDAIVEKFVERKNPKQGDEVLGSRLNSFGEPVFKVRATEDEFVNKAASAVSKKTRNLGLRILPADLVDEAMWQCAQTRKATDAQNPAAARNYLADQFAALRIMPSALDEYLGHPFDQASPAEMDELRAAFAAVREGEAKWVDLVEVQKVRRGEIEKPSKAAEAADGKVKARIEQIKLKNKKGKDGDPVPKADATKPEPTEEEKREIAALEGAGKS